MTLLKHKVAAQVADDSLPARLPASPDIVARLGHEGQALRGLKIQLVQTSNSLRLTKSTGPAMLCRTQPEENLLCTLKGEVEGMG